MRLGLGLGITQQAKNLGAAPAPPAGVGPEAGLTLTTTIPEGGQIDIWNESDPVVDYKKPWVGAFDVVGLDGSSGGVIFNNRGSTGVAAWIGFLEDGTFIFKAGVLASGPKITLAPGTISGDGTMVIYMETTNTISPGSTQIRLWWQGSEIGSVVIGEGTRYMGYTGGGQFFLVNTFLVDPEVSAIDYLPTYTSVSAMRVYYDQLPAEPAPPAGGGLEDGLTLTTTIAQTDQTSNVGTIWQDTSPPWAAPFVQGIDFTGLDGSSGGIIFANRGSGGDGLFIGFLTDGTFIFRAGTYGTTPAEITSAPGAIAGDGTLNFYMERDPDLFPDPQVLIRATWNGVEIGSLQAGLGSRWGGYGSWAYLGTHDFLIDPAVSSIDFPVSYTTASDMRVYADQKPLS